MEGSVSGMPPSRERLRIVLPVGAEEDAINRTPLPGSGGLATGSVLAGKAPTAAGVVLYLALAGSANSKKQGRAKVPGGQKMTLAFRTVCSAQKKEDRLRGKVDLLLRRKEIRVVLLTSCKSNNHATVSFFVFFIDFCWIHGVFRGGEQGSERRGKYKFFNTCDGGKGAVFYFMQLFRQIIWGCFFVPACGGSFLE
jgi:hypothetical protein